MAVEWIEPLASPLSQFLDTSILFVPKLVGAIILLAIGFGIGALVARIFKELLLRFKIDQYISKKGPLLKVSEVFPLLFKWLVYLVFIQASIDLLGIAAISTFVSKIISFIPGVIEGIVVLIVGYVFAEYIKNEIQESKIVYSALMSNVLFWFIMYVAFTMALPFFKVDTTLLTYTLLIVVGSFGLGTAIALGFGLREPLSAIFKDLSKKPKRKR